MAAMAPRVNNDMRANYQYSDVLMFIVNYNKLKCVRGQVISFRCLLPVTFIYYAGCIKKLIKKQI